VKVGDLVRFSRELKGLEDQIGIVVKLSESGCFAWICWTKQPKPTLGRHVIGNYQPHGGRHVGVPFGAQEEMADFLEVISSGSRRSSSL
tara:strand:+ start:1293 stop:1559 length:267 start_codon:yes stop_codon:yes gene_type:complete